MRFLPFNSGRWSISSRMALWYGLTIFVLLGVYSGVTYINFHLSRHHDFDRHLTHEQRVLIPFIHLDENGPRFEKLDELRSVAYQTDGVYGTYVRLLSNEGEVLYESPNFDHHPLLPVDLPEGIEEANTSRMWDAEPIRTRYLPLKTSDGVLGGWLEVTGFEWSLHQELDRLTRILALGILVGVLLAFGGGYLLARRALRPVAAITRAANKIKVSDLSARLPTRFSTRDELTELAETINNLLIRLENSFERERRFSSNAAHELLTPLSTMRGSLELVLMASSDVEACKDAIQLAIGDIDQMNQIVRALLQLSSAERLKDQTRKPIRLVSLCQDHLGRFQDRADVQRIDLSLNARKEVTVNADAFNLGKVVDNLLDNAFKYTPEGGRITVDVSVEGGEARLSVSDNGYGFSEDAREKLFDRFFRSDKKEIQAQPGSGLGLAIVATIVQAYDGSVSAVSDGAGKGSLFIASFPLPKASGAH